MDITFAVVKVAWNGIVPPRDKIETLFREFIATIGPEIAHNSEQLTCFGCGAHFSYLSLKDYGLCIHAGINPARPATDFAWVSLYDPNGAVRRRRIFVCPTSLTYPLHSTPLGQPRMRKMRQPYPRVDRQTYGKSKRENDFKFQPPSCHR